MVSALENDPLEEFTAEADATHTRLKQLPVDALRSKNGSEQEILVRDGRKGTVYVIVEDEGSDSVFVVVQGHFPCRFLPFINNSYVDGFRKAVDGAISELRDDELFGYD